MSYTIATVENEGKHVRTYSDSYGEKYVFNVTTTEGALAQVAKQKPDTPPQKGEVYLKLKSPPDNAPEGALPTLQERDQDASPPPITSSQNGSSGASTNRGFGYQTNPEDAKRMGRCHAQEMALQALAVSETLGVPGVSQAAKDPDGYRALIKKWADWFEEDVG